MADGAEWFRGEGKTCEEIALELGVSRERIRQIEHSAMRKCRRWAEKHGYRPEDLLRCDERHLGD